MNKLKKRKGASSVLILFTVIILIVLGFFTISSATLNYDNSLKASAWSKAYYEIDSAGEAIVAEIDDILFKAEQEAVSYIMNSEYLLDEQKSVPLEIHQINKVVYNNDINNVFSVLNNTYKSLAVEYLKIIEKKYGGEVVTIYNIDGSVYSLYYQNVLEKEEDENYKLEIKLHIRDILYDITIEDYIVSGRKIDFRNRYLITTWKQISQE